MKKIFKLLIGALTLMSVTGSANAVTDGSKQQPLRVILIPADGGTEEGTIADFKPLFKAVTNDTGIHFDIKVAQSYGAAVEAMANKQAEVAWFGAVSYMQAHEKGGAELLAVAEKKGDAVYYSGIFVAKDSGIKSIKDLKGKKVAFGDPSSTSSFNYPVAMLLAEGVDPVKDLNKVYITGSHSNSIAALSNGKVDACACSFPSFGKAVKANAIDPEKFHPLIKSEPIPNPPLAMHPELGEDLKVKLRKAFAGLHTNPAVKPEQIRGYGGKVYEKYNTEISHKLMADAVNKLSKVTTSLKREMLKKAAE